MFSGLIVSLTKLKKMLNYKALEFITMLKYFNHRNLNRLSQLHKFIDGENIGTPIKLICDDEIKIIKGGCFFLLQGYCSE